MRHGEYDRRSSDKHPSEAVRLYILLLSASNLSTLHSIIYGDPIRRLSVVLVGLIGVHCMEGEEE